MSTDQGSPPRIVGFHGIIVAAANAGLVGQITDALRTCGLSARTARTAREVRELVSDRHADLALIALCGAAEDGLAMCRAFGDPVPGRRGALVVIANESELDAVRASLGVDDILLAPVNPSELRTRLRLLAYRRSGLSREGAVQIGDAAVDVPHRTVLLDGVPVYLTFKEYELLHLLIRRRGSVLTRDEILQQVWEADYFGGERTVDVHVRRLRAKLGAQAARLLETIRGVGYRLRRDPPAA